MRILSICVLSLLVACEDDSIFQCVENPSRDQAEVCECRGGSVGEPSGTECLDDLAPWDLHPDSCMVLCGGAVAQEEDPGAS